MLGLRRITPPVLQQLKRLLADDTIPVQSITVKYKDYVVRNEAFNEKRLRPLLFQWSRGSQTESLLFGFYTWGTAESKKYPDTFLALGTDADFRIVGFPLYLLPQDKDIVYLSFKLGNNEGGKNRWFGRGRSSKELRTVEQTDQLALDMRRALQKAFPDPLFSHPTLSGEWLSLAHLSLADLKSSADPTRRIELKTLIFEKLLQAFVIAEKLRDDSLQVAGMLPFESNDSEKDLTPATMTAPLNQILYGPPGTGKTYHTKARAVGIIEGLSDEDVADTYEREEINRKFEEYRKIGQVEFVTFHQSFGYEDFVEGIKPLKPDGEQQVHYGIENGIFKRLCTISSLNSLSTENSETASSQSETDEFNSLFNALISEFSNTIVRGREVEARGDRGRPVFIYAVTENLIRYRHSDVGANHHVSRQDMWDYFYRYRNVEDEFIGGFEKTPATAKRILFNFLIEARNKNARKNTRVNLHLIPTSPPRFVLIIDEINRGNVANIFGELITLLEDDKRAGRPEALTVKLPYSKEDFTVPENLYLLGTMNTADRSVEALDTALRRRFSFTEMQPEARVIREQVGDNGVVDGVDVARILEVLNSRLEQLLDRDHCLGHALLLGINDLEGLRRAFQRNIVPLLQEYFFGDWGKIGLVLGTKFVEISKANSPGRVALANFPGYDGGNMRERPIYRLTAPATWDVAAFQSIYSATPA